MKKILGSLGVMALSVFFMVANAAAEATSYFELPADFASSVNLTLTGVAGAVLIVLALMFAYRKTVKSVNRS